MVQNQIPSDGCVVPATEGAIYRGEGVLDVRVPSSSGSDAGYLFFPLLKNDLPVEADDGPEPNRIALGGFEIDVRFVDGPSGTAELFGALAADPSTLALLRYQAPWSGSLTPGGGTAAATTSAIPAELVQRLRDSDLLHDAAPVRVNALVRAFGSKQGGSIKSDVFTYPIRICDGCLINSTTACPASGTILKGSACNPAQDSAVDCCTQGADLICPATSAP